MNISHKFIILCIFIFLIILFLNFKNTTIKSEVSTIKKYTGGQKIDCRLSEIKKHNLIDNKWVYINGIIYDITPIINLDQLASPDIFKNISMKNVSTFINLVKYTDLQDLHSILKSHESFNIFVNDYNLNEKNEIKVEEFDYELINSTEDTLTQINKEFSNFKMLLLIALKQFKIGIICPSGLTI